MKNIKRNCLGIYFILIFTSLSFAQEVNVDEIDDFIYIQQELERISVAVETLQLWSEKMLAEGKIDKEEYERRKNNM